MTNLRLEMVNTIPPDNSEKHGNPFVRRILRQGIMNKYHKKGMPFIVKNVIV